MIDAKVIEDSIYEDSRLITIQTRAPKFLDAECITGDVLLHFERTATTNELGETSSCLATMSVEDFYNKWHNGITKTVSAKRLPLDLTLVKDREYSYIELSRALNKYDDFIGVLFRTYDDFPGKNSRINGNDFVQWWVKPAKTTFSHPYKNTLSKMRLRCMNIKDNSKDITNIIDIWQTGMKTVYEITVESQTIKASENHLFLTQRGWVAVKELDVNNDQVIMISFQGRKSIVDNYLSFNRSIKPFLLEKQEYKCFDCGISVNEHDDVHHIKPVSQHLELAFAVDNVQVLCKKCHYKAHTGSERALAPGFYSIKSIVKLDEKQMTYDIQVSHPDSNFVANGFVVHNCEKHRMISSNSSSDRAIPFDKMIGSEYFLPSDVRLNEAGMQGSQKLLLDELRLFQKDLVLLREDIIETLLNWKHVHKQHLNRYLLGFSMQDKVMTANKEQFDYFFSLRDSEHADPAIQELARKMKQAIEQSVPQKLEAGEWHLPYIQESERGNINAKFYSVARCARVSYLNHDQTKPAPEKDIALYNKLLKHKHLSCFEHVARPMTKITVLGADGVTHMDKHHRLWSGNFCQWVQFRQLVADWN